MEVCESVLRECIGNLVNLTFTHESMIHEEPVHPLRTECFIE